jgi:hypothetical protein
MMKDVIHKVWRLTAVSLLLGLPAAVLAHAAIFGGAHALGGPNRQLIVVLCAICAGLAGAAAIAFAVRKRTMSPPLSGLIFSTAAWFAAIELREQPHSIPVLPAVALLCLAALAVSIAWRGFANAAAEIAHEFFHQLHVAPRETASQWYGFSVPLVAAHAPAYRLFSRPPPV